VFLVRACLSLLLLLLLLLLLGDAHDGLWHVASSGLQAVTFSCLFRHDVY
jgi:hypothetical protein